MHEDAPVHPRDYRHLAELIRTNRPFVDNTEDAEEMRPGAFLLTVTDFHIWVVVDEASFPTIRLSACVWNLSKCLNPSQRAAVIELADVLHAEAKSTQTRVTLDREVLWLSASVGATVFDPEKFERQVNDFADLAQQLIGPIRRQYSAPGLLGLLPNG